MSLNFDLSKIALETRTIVADRDGNKAAGENFAKGDRIMNPVTNALIWSTLGVGIGQLTEANLAEFAFRLKVTDGLYGKPITERDGPDGEWKSRSFTLDELQAHIGLSTNVSFEKRVTWITRLGNNQVRDIEYALRRKKEDAAKKAAA